MPTSTSRNNRGVAITFGDPGGIGPETIAKALRDRRVRRIKQLIIIGDAGVFRRYCARLPSNSRLLH